MKKFLELIKELKSTCRGRGIVFFRCYAIFFIFVFLLMGFGNKNPNRYSNYESGKSSDASNDKLENYNYLFTYKITLDGVEHIYNGKRNKDTELYQYNDKTYYRNGDSYFVKNDEIWIKSDNPYIFSDFIDSNKINSILELSMLESTTNYEDGRGSFNLLVSTNTLNQKLNNVDSVFLKYLIR